MDRPSVRDADYTAKWPAGKARCGMGKLSLLLTDNPEIGLLLLADRELLVHAAALSGR
jgi:hypothetical protein